MVAIGEAREFQWVFDASRKQDGDGMPWFRFYRTERLVACYYFYIYDQRVGPAFIKICAYAPYPAKAWCNGHEIARRAALAEGIAVTPLANGFAATSDPARLQELCDMVQAGTLRVFFEYWMSRLPLPLSAADRSTAAGGSCRCGRSRSPAPWSSAHVRRAHLRPGLQPRPRPDPVSPDRA